jgi:hypothetical protein
MKMALWLIALSPGWQGGRGLRPLCLAAHVTSDMTIEPFANAAVHTAPG